MRGWLVKAYAVCPALAYFKFHYPEPVTPSMEEGAELDLRDIVEANLELKCPVRYGVALSYEGWKGVVDALMECESSVSVVEVKLRRQFGGSHLAQVVFYCLLAEKALGKECEKVFLCYPDGCEERKVSKAMKEHSLQLLLSLEKDLEALPAVKGKPYCKYCKYSSLCPWSPRN